MPTYNTIGDIRGRDTRKRLVDEDCINIFLGDYFDPYLFFTIEELERNFNTIRFYFASHLIYFVLLYFSNTVYHEHK